MRPLVEPFRHHHFGAGADRPALAFDLDLDAHERLRRRVDDDAPNRNGRANVTGRSKKAMSRTAKRGGMASLNPARFG
jgi:hypothetical protein